jgi:hypothetical protein
MIQTLMIGCGVISIVQGVQFNGSPNLAVFTQSIHDLHTGELIGLRSAQPYVGPFQHGYQFSCSDSRPDVRRLTTTVVPWNDCPTGHRCVVCTSSPDMPEPDPACTSEDYAQLAAALADAGS